MRRTLIGVLLAAAACSGDGPTEPKTVASIRITGASTTALLVGQTLQLTAIPEDESGQPITGREVSWSSSNKNVATVNATGLVTGVAPGRVTITATAGGKSAAVTLDVFDEAALDCTSPLTLALGEVRRLTGDQRGSLCVSAGSAREEFTLIPFSASLAAANRQLEVIGNGLSEVQGPPNPARVPGLSASGGSALVPGPIFDARFDAALRQRELREVVPRIAGARAVRTRRAGQPSLSRVAAALEVGDRVTLNAQSETGCTDPSIRVGRVKAITQHAVVVADTANPDGGFTDEEYQSIGVSFDTLVYPVDIENFGEPADIDENGGRSLLFFTRAVNEMTPANAEGVIAGFFFGRDLLPKDPSQGYQGCPGSNEAELFYLLVPDPTGLINENPRSKESVQRTTVGVLAHEFQHLINASRRIYVNDANEFEVVWLNEGLSHIAEELTFYRSSGLTPRQNIDSLRLRSSQRYLDAINAFQVSNLGRLQLYLEDPEKNSPYANNDDLETRGATWQLLRYLADHKGGDQPQIWRALVNSKNAGFSNLNAVFGPTLELIRDWATAQYTDDAVPNVDEHFTHPSWNYRATVPLLLPSPRRFPLKTRNVSAAPQTFTLVGGGAAYLRFAVGSGTPGVVRLTAQGLALPENVEVMLVRTR